MQWKILLLGTPRVEHNRSMVPIDRRKAIGVLAYLVVHRETVSRETLAAMFWPDSDKALAYLRTTLWTLNNALPENWAIAEGGTLRFNDAADVEDDVTRFYELLRTATPESLRQAVELYRDDFMTGFSLPDAPDFDEWRYVQAESIRRGLVSALNQLIDTSPTQDAIRYARRWLALDNLNESAHRRLMTLYAQEGNLQAAVRQYQEAERLMREELGVSLESETVALMQAIRERRIAPPTDDPEAVVLPGRAAPASARSATTVQRITGEAVRIGSGPRVIVPQQTTPFVGRKHEIAEIRRLLDSNDCRLLTLLGQGGIGKTRLAIEVATQTPFPDGTFFVSLAPVRSEEYVVAAIIDALTCDCVLQNKQDLVNYLSNQRVLLVLDNFEHLIGAADTLGEILAAAPGVKMLVTSRERLNLQEEYILEIEGLDYPRHGDSINDIETFSAVRLFIQAARRARPNYALTPVDVPALIRICQLVDGMPLGIELSATWIQMLSALEIAREIKSSLDFLSTPARNVPERHRNLRAVFEYSWARLEDDERLILSRLSIFRGSFTLEAARSVAEANLHQLLALVGKSLVRRNVYGRYEMHELLRQFAEGKLTPQEREAVAARHSEFFTEFLQRTLPALKSREQPQALRSIDAVMDDLRGAWRYAYEHQRWDWLWAAVEPLMHYASVRERYSDISEMISKAVSAMEHNPQADRLLYGVLLAMQAQMKSAMGSRSEVEEIMARCIPIIRYEYADDPRTIMPLTLTANIITYPVRRFDEARDLIDHTIVLANKYGGAWERGAAMAQLGWWNQANIRYDEALECFRQAYDLFEQTGQLSGLNGALMGMRSYYSATGQAEIARTYLERQIPIYEQLENRMWLTSALTEMEFYNERRNYLEMMNQALRAARDAGDRPQIAWSMYHISWVLINVEAKYEEAIKYLDEALSTFRAIGDVEGQTWAVVVRGTALLKMGNLEAARQCAEEVILDQPKNQFPWSYCGAFFLMGDIALSQKNLPAAREYFRESVRIAHEIHSPVQVRRHLLGLAEVIALEGNIEGGYAIAFYVKRSASSVDQDIPRRSEALAHRLWPDLTPEQRIAAEKRYESALLDDIVREVLQ